jgi:hypothetical protein
MCERQWQFMTDVAHETGAQLLGRLAGKDLNNDGEVVNLVICGDSRFYDFAWLEAELEAWVRYHAWPDLVICGGASGIDALAERWAANHNIPLAVFTEAWAAPRSGVLDDGRPAASPTLVDDLLSHATHVLALPGPHSEWTHRTAERARSRSLPVVVRPVPTEAQ